MRMGGQRNDPVALLPGKPRYAFTRRLDGPQGRCGRMRKISPPPAFNPRTVQPVACNYTEYVIPAHNQQEQKRRFHTGTEALPSLRYSYVPGSLAPIEIEFAYDRYSAGSTLGPMLCQRCVWRRVSMTEVNKILQL